MASSSRRAARPIAAGQRIELADIAVKRPGYGIAVYEREAVVGRVASHDIEEDEILDADRSDGAADRQ